jgi:hypothetical protein
MTKIKINTIPLRFVQKYLSDINICLGGIFKNMLHNIPFSRQSAFVLGWGVLFIGIVTSGFMMSYSPAVNNKISIIAISIMAIVVALIATIIMGVLFSFSFSEPDAKTNSNENNKIN